MPCNVDFNTQPLWTSGWRGGLRFGGGGFGRAQRSALIAWENSWGVLSLVYLFLFARRSPEIKDVCEICKEELAYIWGVGSRRTSSNTGGLKLIKAHSTEGSALFWNALIWWTGPCVICICIPGMRAAMRAFIAQTLGALWYSAALTSPRREQ